MTITSIYEQYQIMPSLQLHMLRVAAVARVIALNTPGLGEVSEITAACLLHDMGNILKFKLDLFPDFLQPQGLEYWEGVKRDFVGKYGTDEHVATHEIARELNQPTRVMDLLSAIGFSKALENAVHSDTAKKICAYSDHRVTPFGVTSLEERMQEGRSRFALNKNTQEDPQKFEQLARGMQRIEQQIFSVCTIKPSDITDQLVNPVVEELREFEMNQKS
ncbi:MAG: HD domain-containing protein [Candidatus Doudnabacteria bacterium]|nr:HD domain-containing protein [Candidatus Doudnabacteria bacterium]